MKEYAFPDSLTGEEIKRIRRKLNFTQQQFAEFLRVSQKTIERWEAGGGEITGPVVALVKILTEQPQIPELLEIPPKKYPMRLYYMFRNEICTVIDVDESARQVTIFNYTNRLQFRAFGREEHPSFERYEEFLKERCFPESRDKMKLILQDLDLPFYDPLLIIEKTQGRMAEDDFWIRIER